MTPSGEHEAPVLEIRTYKLAAGKRDEFDRIFREGALPMLGRHGIHVVGHGRSLVDADHYYLARAFSSAARRREQLEGFYGSEEWTQNYDQAVMPLIETYHTVVIPLGARAAEALSSAAAGDASELPEP
jgi:hypothetical protein